MSICLSFDCQSVYPSLVLSLSLLICLTRSCVSMSGHGYGVLISLRILSVHLSLFLSKVCLSTLVLSLSIHLSPAVILLSDDHSVCLFVLLCVYMDLSEGQLPSLYLLACACPVYLIPTYICLSVFLSVCLSVGRSVCLSTVSLSVHLNLNLMIYIFVLSNTPCVALEPLEVIQTGL